MLIKMRRGKKLKLDGEMYLLLPQLVYDINQQELIEQALDGGIEIHPMKVEKYGLEVFEVPALVETPKPKKAAKKTAKRRK
jgi:hypothetical protein